MEETLLLHDHPPGSLVKLDRYLHNRADGMIGALSHATRGAAIDAILNGTERVTKEGLDAIPLDHAVETPRKPLKKANCTAFRDGSSAVPLSATTLGPRSPAPRSAGHLPHRAPHRLDDARRPGGPGHLNGTDGPAQHVRLLLDARPLRPRSAKPSRIAFPALQTPQEGGAR